MYLPKKNVKVVHSFFLLVFKINKKTKLVLKRLNVEGLNSLEIHNMEKSKRKVKCKKCFQKRLHVTGLNGSKKKNVKRETGKGIVWCDSQFESLFKDVLSEGIHFSKENLMFQ